MRMIQMLHKNASSARVTFNNHFQAVISCNKKIPINFTYKYTHISYFFTYTNVYVHTQILLQITQKQKSTTFSFNQIYNKTRTTLLQTQTHSFGLVSCHMRAMWTSSPLKTHHKYHSKKLFQSLLTPNAISYIFMHARKLKPLTKPFQNFLFHVANNHTTTTQTRYYSRYASGRSSET